VTLIGVMARILLLIEDAQPAAAVLARETIVPASVRRLPLPARLSLDPR
jgi:hypothetical protein